MGYSDIEKHVYAHKREVVQRTQEKSSERGREYYRERLVYYSIDCEDYLTHGGQCAVLELAVGDFSVEVAVRCRFFLGGIVVIGKYGSVVGDVDSVARKVVNSNAVHQSAVDIDSRIVFKNAVICHGIVRDVTGESIVENIAECGRHEYKSVAGIDKTNPKYFMGKRGDVTDYLARGDIDDSYGKQSVCLENYQLSVVVQVEKLGGVA